VKDFFNQIIDEVNPKVFLTIGTSGSVFEQFGLGDAVISRAAKFRLKSEFRNEAFNGNTYRSDWQIPTDHLDAAVALMQPFGTQL
jgi:uridine phosphorylase